jgi:5-methyltetrahydrofolate--homocysteine methyltransferase
VCQALASPDRSAQFVADLQAEYVRVREQHAGRRGPEVIALARARANASRIDWSGHRPVRPAFLGRRAMRNLDLAQVARYIDWGPLLQAWDLAGPYPKILDDPVVGPQARTVLADARSLLEKVIAGRWLAAHAVVGLYPANSVGEDIEIYADESRREPMMTWYGLRQQTAKPVIDGVPNPNQALADFVAPRQSGVADYIGLFALTTGIGLETHEQRLAAEHDDYRAIMLKALADRLAEALAELMHERVRRELWGYAATERLQPEQLIAEAYQGIRPAPGYPACPEHGVKRPLFEVLDAAAIGMALTENFAMTPASSVAGFYIAHPQARYFNVGPIGRDQLEDLARRRGVAAPDLERWLAPNLVP